MTGQIRARCLPGAHARQAGRKFTINHLELDLQGVTHRVCPLLRARWQTSSSVAPTQISNSAPPLRIWIAPTAPQCIATTTWAVQAGSTLQPVYTIQGRIIPQRGSFQRRVVWCKALKGGVWIEARRHLVVSLGVKVLRRDEWGRWPGLGGRIQR